jgi:hypothetical protein
VATNDRNVKQNDAGGWDVVKEGHRRATAHASTKASAVAAASRMTQREGGGKVRVLDTTGKVVATNTVARATPRTRAK